MQAIPEYEALVIKDIDDDYNNRKRYRRRKVGGCCCFLLLTFLLCFFLIPRNPQIHLKSIYLDSNGNGYGSFKLVNNNFYKEKWRNPDISLYWLPYDGQVVGENCYVGNSPCNKYIENQCAIRLGEFKNTEHYYAESRSSHNTEIDLLSSTNEEIACTTWMILNPYQNLKQRLATTGTIKLKNMMNKKKEKINTQYYYYD